MKGTVIKRGKKWAVVVDAGRDADGKRIRKWHSGFDRKRDAESARVEILSRLQSGSYVAPNKVTVGDYLQTWLDGRTSLAETTRSTYSYEMNRLTTILGPRKLLDLQPSEIASAYRELGRRGLSAKSVRNSHAVLHRALKDAMREGLMPRNPADGIELPRASRPNTQAWSVDELKIFLAHIAEHRLFAAWLLAVSTGMRRSEVLGLRWCNVDLDGARVSTVDSLVMARGRPTMRYGETKTSGSRRSIALDSHTVKALQAHRVGQLRERLAAGDAYSDLDLVFASEIGDPVSPDWFTRTTKQLAAAAGVTPLAPHSAARHTWATLALEHGVHPKVVADRLGHRSVSTTLDRYSHVVEGMDRQAAETVANAIGGGQR